MRIGPYVLFEKKAQTDEQLLDMLGGSVTTSSGIAVSSDSALRVPAVAAAVRTIAEAVASLKIGVVSIAEDGTETADRKHPAHALLTDAANDWTSGFEMVRSLMVDALTRDAGGIARVTWSSDGRPLEIIRYRHGIIGVEYDANGSGKPTYRQNGVVLNPDDVIHVRGTFDKSPVTLSREAIGAALVMETHAARLFGAGGRPGSVLRMKKGVGDEGARKMIAGWKAAFDGPNKSGGTAVLWDDAEWQAVTFSSVDSQFQQLRLFQLQEIARAFNIPASLIGDLTRATWSNSAEMQRQFLLLCLEPWLKAIEGALRRALFRSDDRPNFAIRIERDDFSKVDLSVLAVAINGLVSSRTINPNTAREWLGLAPRDGGEEYANPNTGSSQPGTAEKPALPKSGDAPDGNTARENEELRRKIEELTNADE